MIALSTFLHVGILIAALAIELSPKVQTGILSKCALFGVAATGQVGVGSLRGLAGEGELRLPLVALQVDAEMLKPAIRQVSLEFSLTLNPYRLAVRAGEVVGAFRH